MPKARKHQIALDATPYYHCVSRCVRRAFLCGTDATTGKCFEHRRQWLEDRILTLARYLLIDIAAFAVMSNYDHLVLHINKNKIEHWSDLEVCQGWHQLFKGAVLAQKYVGVKVGVLVVQWVTQNIPESINPPANSIGSLSIYRPIDGS